MGPSEELEDKDRSEKKAEEMSRGEKIGERGGGSGGGGGRAGGRSEKEGCRAKNSAVSIGCSHKSIGESVVGAAGQSNTWETSSSASSQRGQVASGAWPMR